MKGTKALKRHRPFNKEKDFRLEKKLTPFTHKEVGIKPIPNLIRNIFLAVC